MSLLKELENDIKKIIHISELIGRYSELLTVRSNINDKYNYNPDLCELLKTKIKVLTEEQDKLKNRWIN
jgi:hypothetical protein